MEYLNNTEAHVSRTGVFAAKSLLEKGFLTEMNGTEGLGAGDR